MVIKNALKEDLIHYLWKTKRFSYKNLKTTDDVLIDIIDWGSHNHHSGPDFSNGKVKIGDTIWAGNIEMHVSSSDWDRHKHSGDPAYDNVILHVVWEHDKQIMDQNGKPIPTLVISHQVNQELMNRYAELMQNELRIPCENLISNVDLNRMNLWLHNILIERLETKTEYLTDLLKYTKNDWNQVFFIALSKYMGLKINAEPFEQLARSFDINIIWKIGNNLTQIEALLFGQAGMLLSSDGDEYYHQLKTEYKHLVNKYKLQHIETVGWKFARMRPANFPTIRIAQLASLMYYHQSIFSKILEAKNVKKIYKILKVSPSSYWNNHYRLNKDSIHKEKPLGDNLIQIIVINVVAPLMFLFGKQIGNESIQEKSIKYLEGVKPEINKITKLWNELDVKAESAYFSQGLIQLKTQYCDQKKCLNCSVGNQLFKV